jgi:hypothetical protein
MLLLLLLQVTPGSEDGWVKVKLTAAGTGWLGFGVAQQGESICFYSIGSSICHIITFVCLGVQSCLA